MKQKPKTPILRNDELVRSKYTGKVLTRDAGTFAIGPAKVSKRATDDHDVFTHSVSSDEPYLREFGYEILSHNPSDINTKRLDVGRVPVLRNHDTDKHIGVVDSYKVTDQKQLQVTMRLSRAEPMAIVDAQDIKDGIKKGRSIGYTVEGWEYQGDHADGNPIYLAAPWTPLEVSVVAVPADETVGSRALPKPLDAAVTALEEEEHTLDEKSPKDMVLDDYMAPDDQVGAPNDEDGAFEDHPALAADPIPVIDPVQLAPDPQNDPIALILSDSTNDGLDEDPEDDGDDEDGYADDGTPRSTIVTNKRSNHASSNPAASPQTETRMTETKNTSVAAGADLDAAKKDREAIKAFARAQGLENQALDWLDKGYTLDKCKAEAFDIRANSHKVSDPVVKENFSTREEKDIKGAFNRELNKYMSNPIGYNSTLNERALDRLAKHGGFRGRSNSILIDMSDPVLRTDLMLRDPQRRAEYTKALTFGASPGSEWGGLEHYLSFEAVLREQPIFRDLGVRLQGGWSGLQRVVRQTSSESVSMVAEGGNVTGSQMATSFVTYAPHTAQSRVAISRQLLQLTQDINALDITQQSMALDLAENFEQQIMAGSSSVAAGQVIGWLYDANVPTYIGTDSGSASSSFSSANATNLNNVWVKQRQNKGHQTNAAFVMTPQAYGTAQVTPLYNASIAVPLLQDGIVNIGGGHPGYNSVWVPTGTGTTGVTSTAGLSFGDHSAVLAGTFGVIEIFIDEATSSANSQIIINTWMYFDSHVLQPNDLVVSTNRSF